MWLLGRLLITCFLYCCLVTGDKKFYSREGKQLYGILDYFQNQKIEPISQLQIPLLILPVIIVPTINLQENVTTSEVGAEENEGSLNLPTDNTEANFTENVNDNNDIEINFRQSLNRGTKVPKREIYNTEPTVKQNNDVLNKSGQDSNNKEVDVNISITDSSKSEEKVTNTTVIFNDQNSIFPETTHTNEFEPLKLTIVTNDESTAPYNSGGEWKNYTKITNLSIVKQNNTSSSENSNSLVVGTNATEGAYTAPLYNDTMIDQISITTNSYTNLESPPTQHDRWKSFSSLKRGSFKPNGFRPLAGLYYDGFIHSSLIKMPGFIPYK